MLRKIKTRIVRVIILWVVVLSKNRSPYTWAECDKGESHFPLRYPAFE